MMSSDYCLEAPRNSYKIAPTFGNPAIAQNTPDSSPEQFEALQIREKIRLTDYEIVTDEGVGIERSTQHCNLLEYTERQSLPFAVGYEPKLHINLKAETITLKSQAKQIDKSIGSTTTELSQNEGDDRVARAQHVPVFSIVPISLARKFDRKADTNLPEIVLTSFEKEKNKNSKAFKEPSTHETHDSFPDLALASTIIKISFPPPPQTEAIRRHLPLHTSNQYTEAHQQEGEAEDFDTEHNNSQNNSSTSPESLMDNILSNASSVSVHSSSMSSDGGGAGTDIEQLERPNATGDGVGNNGSLQGAAGRERHRGCRNDIHVISKPVTKETRANRSLNSKSPELHAALTPLIVQTSPTIPSELNELPKTLQPPEAADTSRVRSRSPSPTSHIRTTRITPDLSLFPDDLKCQICSEVFRDPRTLNCLHSFCYQCIVDENFKQDSSIPFWSQPPSDENEWKASNKSNYSVRSSSPETSLRSESTSPSPRRASFSFRRKKSMERILLKVKPEARGSESSTSLRMSNTEERVRYVTCKLCNFGTELPIGGIRQLPQNFVIVRKIEERKLNAGDEILSRVWCSLCFEETSATYHCVSCTLNLCTLCKDAHERQRTTANHSIKNIMDLRRARKQKQHMLLGDNAKFSLKCGMHPGFEMKSFCATCLQIACADCLVLLHKGHKHESIGKAIANYGKILKDSAEQTRPLCNYAEHSIERLNEIAKNINTRCDFIQSEVETFMQQYFEAVEVHRKTLLQQVHRARESKVEMILEQQLDLEKRTTEAMDAVRFSQELMETASEVEILSFVNILLKRFEYCQQFKMPIDPKISDSLHFLPKIRAPSTKTQNDIPLFGIITMQTVEPSLCTMQLEGFTQLRLHKKVELIMLSRDADGVPLCHGGLQINAHLKYKESNSKFLPIEISDQRDGTYIIAFTPDSQGTILLTVTINDKPIKGSPYTFLARTVRPHNGIFHCCAFCSSKGNKMAKCSCEGRMPGYNGCGHGHAGHPGRRHWSCCGNVLENSECNVANKLLNS